MSEQTKNAGPVKTFQSGLLNVAVFAHEGTNGRVWFSASPQRSYKKEGTEEWQRINSYNRDDLPVIAGLMNRAWAWICVEEEKARAANRANAY